MPVVSIPGPIFFFQYANRCTDAIASLLTALKTPDEVPAGTNLDEPTKTDDGLKNVDKMTNAELVRSNPETWVYLCVSYWYTLNKGYYFPDGGKGAKVST